MNARPTAANAAARAVVVGLGKSGFSAGALSADAGLRGRGHRQPCRAAGMAAAAGTGHPARARDRRAHAAASTPRCSRARDLLVVSPGVAPTGRVLRCRARARSRRASATSSCSRARRARRWPAITGTNGKSTVTTLLAEMAARAGTAHSQRRQSRASRRSICWTMRLQLYVLELSSFQLETTEFAVAGGRGGAQCHARSPGSLSGLRGIRGTLRRAFSRAATWR